MDFHQQMCLQPGSRNKSSQAHSFIPSFLHSLIHWLIDYANELTERYVLKHAETTESRDHLLLREWTDWLNSRLKRQLVTSDKEEQLYWSAGFCATSCWVYDQDQPGVLPTMGIPTLVTTISRCLIIIKNQFVLNPLQNKTMLCHTRLDPDLIQNPFTLV